MNKLAKINILKLKKILQSKGYRIQKRQKKFPKFFENFFYITLVGFFVIGFFYTAPIIIDFSKKNLGQDPLPAKTSSCHP